MRGTRLFAFFVALFATIILYLASCLAVWLLGGGVDDLQKAAYVAVGTFVVVYLITRRTPPKWFAAFFPALLGNNTPSGKACDHDR